MVCYYEGAIILGAFIGVISIAGVAVFIQRVEWMKIKQYYWRLDDAKRESVMKSLVDIQGELENLANDTNTTYCRRKSNSILDLITFIKKHRLN